MPSIHLKQPGDTRKGQMWNDIGLGDWYFLIDETPASQISDALLKIHTHYPEAKKKLKKAKDLVDDIQQRNMKTVRKAF